MKLALDTNIFCEYAAGVPEVVEFLATQCLDILLPVPVLGELSYGFMKGRRQRLNESKLQDFIRRFEVDIIVIDQEVARKYGLIFLSLTKNGTRIPINDVWIAACCMASGAALLTRDTHFRHIEQIETVGL